MLNRFLASATTSLLAASHARHVVLCIGIALLVTLGCAHRTAHFDEIGSLRVSVLAD